MDRLPVSSAVPAEIAERISDRPEIPEGYPDFAEPEDYAGIVDERLAKPLARLYSTRDQIRLLKGACSSRECLEWLLKDLASLEADLALAWSEQ